MFVRATSDGGVASANGSQPRRNNRYDLVVVNNVDVNNNNGINIHHVINDRRFYD